MEESIAYCVSVDWALKKKKQKGGVNEEEQKIQSNENNVFLTKRKNIYN